MNGTRIQRAIVCGGGLLATILVVVNSRNDSKRPTGDTSADRIAVAVVANDGPDTCEAPSTWFPKTPKPDPHQSFNSFCDFHQWSWQSFLYLTENDPATGRPRFEAFPTNDDVIHGKLPAPGRLLKLTPRVRKSNRPPNLDEIDQAGENGLLVDHQGRAVYFSQQVNLTMFHDIVDNGWNDPKVLNQIPPTTVFEIGDVELKISWKIVLPGEDASKYLVQRALIDKLVNRNGAIVVDPSQQIEVDVAMVGMHIAGWVDGNEEAIWATFEHVDNAPDFAVNQDANLPVSGRDWTFYTANTKALACNQLNGGGLKLNEQTQVLSPVTQVARVYPSGMVAGTTDPNDLQNLAAITTLNASVRKQLAKTDVRWNYFEVGAIWTTGTSTLKPNETQQNQLVGSKLLSNSTIETFTQTIASQNNCFSCHNTMMYSPGKPNIRPLQGTNINLSHIIIEAYEQNQ